MIQRRGARYLAKILESLETPHLVLIKVPIVLIDHMKVPEKIRKPFIALKKVLKKIPYSS